MFKNLIHYFNYVRPGGGPAGYLYNLSKATSTVNNVDVFYKEVRENNQATDGQRQNPYVLFFSLIIKTIFRRFGRLPKDFLRKIDNDTLPVFHTVYDAIKYSKYGKNYLLMIHSPKEPQLEIIDTYKDVKILPIIKKIYQWLLALEEKRAIKRAYALIVPAEGAMDAYYKESEALRLLVNQKRKLIVPTGVRSLQSSKSKAEMRETLNISKDDKLIGFFGRFNEDKGFDTFCDIVSRNQNKNIKFVSAGHGPIAPVFADNYTNLGWRSDMADLISACDYVIVPNKVSYFDLIILESFSLGVKVITTSIGGAKGLPKTSTLFLDYSKHESLPAQFYELISSDSYDRKEILNDYQSYTLERFARNYSEILDELE